MQEKGVSTSLLTAATDIIAQFAMFANLNQIATLISMGYQVSHSFSKIVLAVGGAQLVMAMASLHTGRPILLDLPRTFTTTTKRC